MRQALVALRRGQREAAAHSLMEGLALAQAMPYPSAEAHLLHPDGVLHVQHGDAEAARARLQAASAISTRLGARMDTERAEQILVSIV
jgi:hypothetical protein